MALVIPDIQNSPTFDAQALLDQTDLNAIMATDDGNGVLSGCAVTPHTGSDMNIAIAAGVVIVNGVQVSVSAVTSLAVGAASTDDRKDIVTVNSSGTVSVTAGTPCTTAGWSRTSTALPPVKPAIPANSVLLAEVYVASTTTAIASANILDKTALMVSGTFVESYITGTVALGATTIVNITSVTLAAGTWLVTGRAYMHLTTATLGHGDLWLGPTTASVTSAYAATTFSMGDIAGGTEEQSVSLTKVITLTTSTVVFLEAYCTEASTAENNSLEKTIGNCSGITAVRIS